VLFVVYSKPGRIPRPLGRIFELPKDGGVETRQYNKFPCERRYPALQGGESHLRKNRNTGREEREKSEYVISFVFFVWSNRMFVVVRKFLCIYPVSQLVDIVFLMVNYHKME
jgi:hypothetical protein